MIYLNFDTEMDCRATIEWFENENLRRATLHA